VRLRTLDEWRPLDVERLVGPAPDVARALIGALLVRREDDGHDTVVRLVETEAYREDDPASHSHRGRTASNAVMFGPAGRAYVYFTYGMHHCVNVVTGPDGHGAAALLRAAVVLRGLEHVRARRGERHRERDLLAGPGRLTQGLAIDRALDGADLLDPAGPLVLATDGWWPDESAIRTGPRIGVRHAADVGWRFHLADVPEVSRYARHPRAPRRRA
jgi:DNA-3-methyladenine glycosylase